MMASLTWRGITFGSQQIWLEYSGKEWLALTDVINFKTGIFGVEMFENFIKGYKSQRLDQMSKLGWRKLNYLELFRCLGSDLSWCRCFLGGVLENIALGTDCPGQYFLIHSFRPNIRRYPTIENCSCSDEEWGCPNGQTQIRNGGLVIWDFSFFSNDKLSGSHEQA